MADQIESEEIRIRKKLDYPQLVFEAIRAIITSSEIPMFIIKIQMFRSILYPSRNKDSTYKAEEKTINEKYSEITSGLDPMILEDKHKIRAAELKRMQNIFESLMDLADRVGLLGEKELTEQI